MSPSPARWLRRSAERSRWRTARQSEDLPPTRSHLKVRSSSDTIFGLGFVSPNQPSAGDGKGSRAHKKRPFTSEVEILFFFDVADLAGYETGLSGLRNV